MYLRIPATLYSFLKEGVIEPRGFIYILPLYISPLRRGEDAEEYSWHVIKFGHFNEALPLKL